MAEVWPAGSLPSAVIPAEHALPHVATQFFRCATPEHPLVLSNGTLLSEAQLAYETYGTLNAEASNAIMVFHAMTGSQHAAGWNPHVPGLSVGWTEECCVGWWEEFIGPGRALDTDVWFVICANHLGGCYGSTGPTSIDPATGKPYGGDFPSLTIGDIVDAHRRLLAHLGIYRLRAAVGGSIGGLMVLDWAVRYPQELELAVPIASGAEVTPLQRVLNLEQVVAITCDADFSGGHYAPENPPRQGLSLARMIAHKTFISLAALDRRARQEIIQPGEGIGTYRLVSPHESYMLHQGKKFVERFDANSYLRIVEAWQRFDLAAAAGTTTIDEALQRAKGVPFLLFTIDSDVCFYPEEQEQLESLLRESRVPVSRVVISSPKGHDAFLLEPHLFAPALRAALSEPAAVGTPHFLSCLPLSIV